MPGPTLAEALKAVEPAYYFVDDEEVAETTRTQRRHNFNWSADVIAELEAYLEHPTQQGFWRLTCDWKPEGELATFVFDFIKDELFGEPEAPAKGRKARPKYSGEVRRKVVDTMTSTITFVS